jgi:proline dehydrogenase
VGAGRLVGMRVDRAILFKLATNERLEQVVKGVPGGEENAWRAASRYVAGRTRDEALQVAEAQVAKGHGISVDLFGEMSTDPADAARVVDEYLELAKLLPAPPADVWLSLDLSHLALDVDPAGAADHIARIAEALSPGRVTPPGPTRSCTASWTSPVAVWRIASALPSRPICNGPRTTSTR